MMINLSKITGTNAGGPPQLPMRTRPAARAAQFWRWTAPRHGHVPAFSTGLLGVE